ncbi:MAG TPA: class I SAM-dependent methyltransferase [Candidatus Paceibacterota bacterium]|nr:class I SAM-dependent methyltransferase [Candidatus Paceibacterota bacterium]
MQKTTEQTAEWTEIWERQGLLDSIIDAGRSIYNAFFRPVLRRYLNKNSTILEMGCGRASLTLSLAPEVKKLVGVDISPVAVEQATAYAAKHGITNATFTIDDCTNMSLQEKFDFVWSQGLLEHFDDPLIVANEHYKALAPGGTALLSVPYRYSYHHVWYLLTRPQALRIFWPWTEQRFFNKTMLLAVGKAVTPHARVYLLQPFPLGLVFLELTKPKE